MRSPNRRVIVALVSAVTALASPSAALELRLPADDQPLLEGGLTRAYAPCTAPNTVTWLGQPACQPAITSACTYNFRSGVRSNAFGGIVLVLEGLTGPGVCKTGIYTLQTRGRLTTDQPAADDEEVCDGPICTRQDEYGALQFNYSPRVEVFLQLTGFDSSNGTVELVDATIIAPDGLPMATLGTNHITAAAGVSYPECTSPDPGRTGCTAAPWRPACDFESGTIDFVGTASPGARVRLSKIAGITPLCTTGTYQLVADVRATVTHCDNDFDAPACTLPDRTVTFDLPADGTELDVSRGLAPGGIPGVLTAQIIGPRLYDPTGARLAAIAVPGALKLTAPRITMRGDQLRLEALFPLDGEQIDPTASDGVTFGLTDRNGTLFLATIPADRWQLQPPVGERWDYKDPGGVVAGIRKARVRLKRKKGIAVGYDVRLDAKGFAPVSGVIGVNLTITMPFVEGAVVQSVPAQRSRMCRTRGKKITCD